MKKKIIVILACILIFIPALATTVAADPGSEVVIKNVRGGYYYVHAVFKNVGDELAYPVGWNISIKGKTIDVLTQAIDGRFPTDARIRVRTNVPLRFVHGFEKVDITINIVYPPHQHVTWTGVGFVFGPFIFGVKEK